MGDRKKRTIPPPKKGGRRIKFQDEYHRVMRERQRIYTEKNREAWNLANRLQISVAEARKLLGIKPNLKRQPGKRKKRSKKK